MMGYCSKCDLPLGLRQTCFKHPKAKIVYRSVVTHPNIDFPVPWAKVMEDLLLELLPYKDSILIDQIKEKWGDLRVYYTVLDQKEGSTNFHVSDDMEMIVEKYAKRVEALYPTSKKNFRQ